MARTRRWSTNRTADPELRSQHALALLEHEDRSLLAILDRFETESDALAHGRAGQLFVEHLALRQAAREQVAAALADEPAVGDVLEVLGGHVPERRAELVELFKMSRGVGPMELDVGQPFDQTVAGLVGPLRREIRAELDEVIPAVEHRVSDAELDRLLPTARQVTRHALSHPDPDGSPRARRFAPFRRLRALYQWVRRLPSGGPDLEPPWLEEALRAEGEPSGPDTGDPEAGAAGRP